MNPDSAQTGKPIAPEGDAASPRKRSGPGPAHASRPSVYGGRGAGYGQPYGYGHGYGAYGGAYGGQHHGSHGLPLIGVISVERILLVLVKKWTTLFIMAIFGLCAALFYISRTTPIYRATSVIEMNVRQPRFMSTAGALADDGGMSPWAAFNTRIAKLSGTAMSELAAAVLKEAGTPPSHVSASALRAGVRFSERANTTLVNVIFEHSDPNFAAEAANAFAEATRRHEEAENTRTSESAVTWLQQQAEAQRKNLADAEQALIDFRVANNIDALEQQKASAEQTLLALNAALVETEKTEVLTEKLLDFPTALEWEDGATKPPALPSGMPREGQIQSALGEWISATQALGDMARKYTDAHPKMIEMKAQLAAARARLNDELELTHRSVESKLALLCSQSEGIRQKIADGSKVVSQLEQQVVERRTRLTAMERERDARDLAYRGILNRIEEARLSADENSAIVKLSEPATVPSRPIKPRKGYSILLGLVFGLIGGFGLAMISENMEDKVSSFSDIEQDIGVKVLGLIPRSKRGSRKDLALASLNDRFGRIPEAFANVRSLLNTQQLGEQTQSLLIVSAVPEEGKTTTACNLATASAVAGRRTLLVDFDMRRPRLRGIFGQPNKDASLLHVLSKGNAGQFEKLPKPVPECENLYVVSSHPSDSISPAEVMGTEIVPRFLEWAKEHFDRVVIDSPPCGVVADAAVLADRVGAVIVVFRPDRSRKKASRHLISELRSIGANVIGAIVNDIDFNRNAYCSNYDYHGSYHSYRGYQYDTSEGGDGEKKRRTKQAERDDA